MWRTHTYPVTRVAIMGDRGLSPISDREEITRDSTDNQSLSEPDPTLRGHVDKECQTHPFSPVSGTSSTLGGSVKGRKKLLPEIIKKYWCHSMNQKKHRERKSPPYHNPKSSMHLPIHLQSINLKKRNATSTQKELLALK